MSAISWGPELEIDVPEIDRQHRRLVDIYNRMHEALLHGKGHKRMSAILADLIDYTAEHFAAEEEIMADAGYPELELRVHRSEHEQLLGKVRRFQRRYELGLERVSKPVMELLDHWLRHHIRGSDAEFGRYLASVGADAAPVAGPHD
jgi:hemerythrin